MPLTVCEDPKGGIHQSDLVSLAEGKLRRLDPDTAQEERDKMDDYQSIKKGNVFEHIVQYGAVPDFVVVRKCEMLTGQELTLAQRLSLLGKEAWTGQDALNCMNQLDAEGKMLFGQLKKEESRMKKAIAFSENHSFGEFVLENMTIEKKLANGGIVMEQAVVDQIEDRATETRRMLNHWYKIDDDPNVHVYWQVPLEHTTTMANLFGVLVDQLSYDYEFNPDDEITIRGILDMVIVNTVEKTVKIVDLKYSVYATSWDYHYYAGYKFIQSSLYEVLAEKNLSDEYKLVDSPFDFVVQSENIESPIRWIVPSQKRLNFSMMHGLSRKHGSREFPTVPTIMAQMLHLQNTQDYRMHPQFTANDQTGHIV